MERARGPAGFGQTAGRTELEQFEAFYDFAFPRVHRFAARRMDTAEKAEALTELILESSLTSLGGARAPENGLRGVPAELAFRLFAIAQRVADQVKDDPSLLAGLPRPDGLYSGSQSGIHSGSPAPVATSSELKPDCDSRSVRLDSLEL